MGKIWKKLAVLLMATMILTGCGGTQAIDDYATNQGTKSAQKTTEETEAKEKIKVGVIHLTDPAEGSGYTYSHDLGIQGMQQNLGLSDDQIIRKINVDDTDKKATEKAIKECIDEGCNVIFATSWGYMEKV